jgi:hypothetical protein
MMSMTTLICSGVEKLVSYVVSGGMNDMSLVNHNSQTIFTGDARLSLVYLLRYSARSQTLSSPRADPSLSSTFPSPIIIIDWCTARWDSFRTEINKDDIE